jgi:hypothetical protein
MQFHVHLQLEFGIYSFQNLGKLLWISGHSIELNPVLELVVYLLCTFMNKKRVSEHDSFQAGIYSSGKLCYNLQILALVVLENLLKE